MVNHKDTNRNKKRILGVEEAVDMETISDKRMLILIKISETIFTTMNRNIIKKTEDIKIRAMAEENLIIKKEVITERDSLNQRANTIRGNITAVILAVDMITIKMIKLTMNQINKPDLLKSIRIMKESTVDLVDRSTSRSHIINIMTISKEMKDKNIKRTLRQAKMRDRIMKSQRDLQE